MRNLKYILLAIFCFQFTACNDEDDGFTIYEGEAKTAVGKLISEKTSLVAMVKSDTTYNVTSGVETTEMHYVNSEGYSIKAFIMQVDLTDPTVNIEVATPNNEPKFSRQIMTKQAAFKDSEDNLVWAGFNGDFFDSSTGVPRGIVYKDGIAIKSSFISNEHTWFAINKDGTASIGDTSEYDKAKDNFLEAIGGRVILVSDGLASKQTDMRLEPRTAIGVSQDGKSVYILVVDGRNFTYSNGISYAQMGEIFIALGAYDAINLDGGGSSTYFIRNTPEFADDRFQLRNWPSDNGGQERAVANGLLIISK